MMFFVGSHVVSFVKTEAFLLHLELEEPVLGVPGNCILADLWEWKLKKKQFCETQIQMVDFGTLLWYLLYLWISISAVSFFDESSKFSHQNWASGAMSGMLTNLTSEASSKPAHGNFKEMEFQGDFLGTGKKKGQFSWYISWYLMIFWIVCYMNLYRIRVPLFFGDATITFFGFIPRKAGQIFWFCVQFQSKTTLQWSYIVFFHMWFPMIGISAC